MTKRITRKMLEKRESELIGKTHSVKISDLNDFGMGLKRNLTYQNANVSVYFPYKNGWIIQTREIGLNGYANKEFFVANDEIIQVIVEPYYTI